MEISTENGLSFRRLDPDIIGNGLRDYDILYFRESIGRLNLPYGRDSFFIFTVSFGEGRHHIPIKWEAVENLHVDKVIEIISPEILKIYKALQNIDQGKEEN